MRCKKKKEKKKKSVFFVYVRERVSFTQCSTFSSISFGIHLTNAKHTILFLF